MRRCAGDRLRGCAERGPELVRLGSRPRADIDLGLVVSDSLLSDDDAVIQVVADTERGKGSALHERLSMLWGTPSTLRGKQAAGRFPALDRLDLIEDVRLLAGTDDARWGVRYGRPLTRSATDEFCDVSRSLVETRSDEGAKS